jgi:hypothetical protein
MAFNRMHDGHTRIEKKQRHAGLPLVIKLADLEVPRCGAGDHWTRRPCGAGAAQSSAEAGLV